MKILLLAIGIISWGIILIVFAHYLVFAIVLGIRKGQSKNRNQNTTLVP